MGCSEVGLLEELLLRNVDLSESCLLGLRDVHALELTGLNIGWLVKVLGLDLWLFQWLLWLGLLLLFGLVVDVRVRLILNDEVNLNGLEFLQELNRDRLNGDLKVLHVVLESTCEGAERVSFELMYEWLSNIGSVGTLLTPIGGKCNSCDSLLSDMPRNFLQVIIRSNLQHSLLDRFLVFLWVMGSF